MITQSIFIAALSVMACSFPHDLGRMRQGPAPYPDLQGIITCCAECCTQNPVLPQAAAVRLGFLRCAPVASFAVRLSLALGLPLLVTSMHTDLEGPACLTQCCILDLSLAIMSKCALKQSAAAAVVHFFFGMGSSEGELSSSSVGARRASTLSGTSSSDDGALKLSMSERFLIPSIHS